MLALQRVGVAAGVVRRPLELLEDPHLLARNFWSSVDRAHIGPHAQPAPAIREAGDPYLVRSPAPTLGEYNEPVLRDLLGLSDSEIAALEASGVIGSSLLAEKPTPEKAPA